MLAEISVSNPKRTALKHPLKHPLINIIMAKKASPSAAVTKVAMRVQIKVSATTIQASDVKAVAAGVEPSVQFDCFAYYSLKPAFQGPALFQVV